MLADFAPKQAGQNSGPAGRKTVACSILSVAGLLPYSISVPTLVAHLHVKENSSCPGPRKLHMAKLVYFWTGQ